MRRLAAALVVLLGLGACFGPDANLTKGGKGKPVLSIDFPDTVPAGAPATATLTVENPGPGDMGSIVVAFATVGVAAASGPPPAELVPVSTSPDNPSVASVTPEPQSVSRDGVVYVFGGVAEGATTEIRFEIVAPEETGRAANSVSVYDGAEPDRISGVRIETLVTG
jgi:hypothetical protein